MATASGMCPNCGAPIEFALGSSIAKVCDYCRATVCRTDRGLDSLGKLADLVDIPSAIDVGDQGTVGGRPFRVHGRVQLDHGKGPWDEFYVALDDDKVWGWLAYAEGHWLLTVQQPGVNPPPYQELQLEQAVKLGDLSYVVTEVKSAHVVAAQGELPVPFRAEEVRVYADLLGKNRTCATLDYGDNDCAPEVFAGWVIEQRHLTVLQTGPRASRTVPTDHLRCVNCGGDVPKFGGDHARRLGCPYCGALTDLVLQRVIAEQDAARKAPDIPLGSRGTIEDTEYVCLAFLERSALFEGERFTWEEYLLFSPVAGFRWLVNDQGAWLFAAAVNPGDLDLSRSPNEVRFGQYTFALRSTQHMRVEYVIGEVYWQVEVGETVSGRDYTCGTQVLSREQGPGEVRWSYASPLTWATIVRAFGVQGAGRVTLTHAEMPRTSLGSVIAVLGVVCLVLACCVIVSAPFVGSANSFGSGGFVFGGSGGYYGGK